jgi:hypothetical protein
MPMKRSPLSRAAAGALRSRSRPRLEMLEDRLPPGDVFGGALLGCETIAASDALPPAAEALSQSARQARLLPDLDDPDTLPGIVDARQGNGPANCTVPASGASARPAQDLPDPGSPHAAPASRLVAEGQGNAVSSASAFITAPPGPGNPAPAFAAVAGAIVQQPPSARATAAGRPSTGAATVNRTQVMNSLDRSGLSFERNVGQTASRVDYVARTGGATVFLTPTAAVFAIQKPRTADPAVDLDTVAGMPSPTLAAPSSNGGVAVYMQIVGANPSARPVGQKELPGKVNYFIGNDPAQWHSNIPTFGRVEYPNIYPGISLAYYGGPGGLEYDFILAPGADAHAIALNFAGANGLEVNDRGELVLHTAAGDIVEQKPLAYEPTDSGRQEVASRYVLDGHAIRFEVAAHDPTRPLVIDPLVLGYSTFLGGGGGADIGWGIAVNESGNAYVAGETASIHFPTTPGVFDSTYNGAEDAFVAELNASGSALVYGTYVGGNGRDRAFGLAVDTAGNAYVTGDTESANFPTTPGAFDTTYNGAGDYYGDAFAVKLNASGSALVYGTYLGGTNDDSALGIAADGAGDAYVIGFTKGMDFPTTPGAFDTTWDGGVDAFVVKLNPSGSALTYGTYLGGSGDEYGTAIAVDGAGNAYVTGVTYSPDFPATPGAFDTTYTGIEDAFVAKLNASGSSLLYASYLGGSIATYGYAIAVDGSGNAFVTGTTSSPDFPATPGAFDTTFNGGPRDAFVVKLGASGSSVTYGTYLGGSDGDFGYAIAVDGVGNTYVTGVTYSVDFPTTADAFDTTFNGNQDAFVAKLNPVGSALVYGTYLGGSNDDYGFGVAVDQSGNTYVTGASFSTDFPTTPGALKRRNRGASDGIVAKFVEG